MMKKVPKALKAGVWERWVSLELKMGDLPNELNVAIELYIGEYEGLGQAKWMILADDEGSMLTRPIVVDVQCTNETFLTHVDEALAATAEYCRQLNKGALHPPPIELRVFYELTIDSACFWVFWLKRMPIMRSLDEFEEYLAEIPHYALFLATLHKERLGTTLMQVMNAKSFYECIVDNVRRRLKARGKHPGPFFFTVCDDSLIEGRPSLLEPVEFECTRNHILVSERIDNSGMEIIVNFLC